MSVCNSNSNGGLGIKHCKLFNVRLLIKWAWKILNDHNSLWFSIFLFIYGDIKSMVLDPHWSFNNIYGEILGLPWSIILKMKGCLTIVSLANWEQVMRSIFIGIGGSVQNLFGPFSLFFSSLFPVLDSKSNI